jgi:hypothetical protein
MATTFQNWLMQNNYPGVQDMTPGMYSNYSNQFQNQGGGGGGNLTNVIDTSNPQVMHAGFSWPFGRNQGLESNRPYGIDTPMNYQDQIRSAPGGNYQGWEDLIVDDTRGANLIESDFQRNWELANKQGLYDDEGTGQREINYEDAPVGFSGFFTGDRRLHPNNPLLKLTQGLGSIFQPNEQMEAAIGDIRETGEFGGQRYNIDEARNKIYSEVNPFGKNLRSGFGSDDPTEMDNKTLARAMDRLSKGKAISTRLRNILQNRGMLDVTGVDRVGGDTTGVPFHPGQGGATTGGTTGGYEGPPTTSFNVAQFARSGGQRPDKPGGFTDPGRGSYGPWMATGGRAGYANRGFVDEDINVEGPGFDVNENIEMASRGGEEDILEQLIAKYIEAGFPPDQAQAMAMQELQQMVAESGQGQGEGIASLV